MDFAFKDDFIKFTQFHVYIDCKSRTEAAILTRSRDEAHTSKSGGGGTLKRMSRMWKKRRKKGDVQTLIW